MKTGYCQSCEQATGFKRSIGVGTLLGAACTGGVSLVATPFYPLRCVRCGSVKEPVVHHVSSYREEPMQLINPYDKCGFFVVIAIVILLAAIRVAVDAHFGK